MHSLKKDGACIIRHNIQPATKPVSACSSQDSAASDIKADLSAIIDGEFIIARLWRTLLKKQFEMKLSFRKSGGLVPLFQGCQFDTEANIPDADALQLEALVGESGIMSEKNKKVPAARDVFYYTFDIELAGKKNIVTFDHLSVPPKIQPLLGFLLARAKNMLPD